MGLVVDLCVIGDDSVDLEAWELGVVALVTILKMMWMKMKICHDYKICIAGVILFHFVTKVFQWLHPLH